MFKKSSATYDIRESFQYTLQRLPRCKLTLNLLRAARANPKLSAYAYLNGQFDFNKTPLTPPGTKIVAHNLPNNRPSWGPNGEEGWTVGFSPDHYRCIRCYFPSTKSEQDVSTVTFFPSTIPRLASR